MLLERKEKIDKYIGRQVYYQLVNLGNIYLESGILQYNYVNEKLNMVLSYIGPDKNTNFCINSLTLLDEEKKYIFS